MLAALRGHIDVCKVLLDHGADASAVDLQGKTALELARHADHEAVVAMLRARCGAAAQCVAIPPPIGRGGHEAAVDADAGIEGGDGWEPEDREWVPAHDVSCVAAATQVQESFCTHVAVDRDEEWGDVDVDLPLPLASGGRVILDEPTRVSLRSLFASAMDAGWVSADQIFQSMCGGREHASDLEAELARKSLQCLTDHGVVADDEAWALPILDPDELRVRGDGESEAIDAMLAEVEHSISPRHDPLWSFARDLKYAGPLLDHGSEIQLGSEMQLGVRQAVLALFNDERAAAILLATLEERAAGLHADPASSADIEQLDVALSADLPVEEVPSAAPSDELPIDVQSVGQQQTAVETVNMLRLATRQQFLATGPRDIRSFERLLQDSIAMTGLGVVQLFEVLDRLPLDTMPRPAHDAFHSGLAAAASARDRLVRCNLRLVWSIARKYTFSGIPLPDLIQEGCIGLMRAADKYDHTRGFRFSTYATWWIRQSVSRSVAESSRMIRVPVHMFERLRNVERAVEAVRLRLDREPRIGEISAELGLTETEVRKVVRIPHEPASTDDPSNADWSDHLDPSLTEIATPEERLTLSQLQEWVSNTVDGLKPKDALILRMRYGLGTERDHTLEEVGRALDVTRERIRQIEKKALRLLKRRLQRETVSSAQPRDHGDFDDEDPDDELGDLSPAQPAREMPAMSAEGVPAMPIPEVAEPTATTRPSPVRVVAHALKLLASSQVQRGIAASLNVPSLQREFARRWFSAYNAIDPEEAFSAAQHGAFQFMSSALRKALRRLGFGRIDIDDLLRDPSWQDVMEAASIARRHLSDE